MAKMSDDLGIAVTEEGLQKVRNYIENCVTKYMTKKETAETIFEQKKIDPRFTRIVWNLLEQENPEFFKAYYTRLALKEQIERFNKLLEQQAALMSHLKDASTSSDDRLKMPLKGSDMKKKGPAPIPEDRQWPIASRLNDGFLNSGSYDNSWIQNTPVDPYIHGTGYDVYGKMLLDAQNNFLPSGPVIHDPSAFLLPPFPPSLDMGYYPQLQGVVVNRLRESALLGRYIDYVRRNDLSFSDPNMDYCNAGMVDNQTSFLPQDMGQFQNYIHNGANGSPCMVDNHTSFLPQDMSQFYSYNHNGMNENSGMAVNHSSFLPQDMSNFPSYSHNGANDNRGVIDNQNSFLPQGICNFPDYNHNGANENQGVVDSQTSFLPQDMSNVPDYNHNGANENQADNPRSKKAKTALTVNNPSEGPSDS